MVAGRFLVCGEGLHYTLNARVFCMDVARGKILWTYETHGHVESTPCIDKGRVYVGAGTTATTASDSSPTPRAMRGRRRSLARPSRTLPRCRHLAGGTMTAGWSSAAA